MHAHSGAVVAVVRIAGDLDFGSAPGYRRLVTAAAATPGLDTLVIDIGAVGFLDSSGLALMSLALRLCAQHGCELLVRGASARHRKLIRITGLADVIMLDPPMPPAAPELPGAQAAP